MLFVGLDLGGTFVKSAALDLDAGCVRHVAREPFPSFRAGGPLGARELAAEPVVRVAERAVARVLAREPGCRGLVVCGQMHGLVLADPEGRPLSPFVSWQDGRALVPDGRGETVLSRLVGRLAPEETRALGNETRAGLPVTRLFALAEERALPEKAAPLALADFVLRRLGAEERTDPTNAAAHGLFDVGRGCWHAAVIRRLGLERLRWPEVAPFPARAGTVNVGGTRLEAFVAVGDQQCALLGALLARGELSINVGTGSQASRLVDAPEPGAAQCRPFFDGGFLRTVTHIPAGRALAPLVHLLSELAPELSEERAWEILMRKARDTGPSELRVDLSLFPHGRAGALESLREDGLTAGAVMRGALEAMARSYEAAEGALFPGETPRALVFSGGLARPGGLLRDLVLARLPLPVRETPCEEDTLAGLLLMAHVASGRAANVADAAAAAGKMPFMRTVP